MSTTPGGGLSFAHLVNLADEALGARAVATSDDFFAPMDNLVRSSEAVFDPNAYTDRGKLMDGWESRRKRESGHDWCVVALGCPGRARLFDIDTSHFLGNHPPFASVEAARSTPEALAGASWVEILEQVPLRPGTHNVFASRSDEIWTHLRLNIFPDGGVARLRAFGEVESSPSGPYEPDEQARGLLRAGERDLAALTAGGLALACSDAFFGPMNNLLLPGRAANMGGGWETRRRRGPGSDWIVVRLGAVGTIGMLELDTHHFKGNYPEAASVEGIHRADARLTELVDPALAWSPILQRTKLQAHHRHFFRDELVDRGPFSHVRLRIFPDGGVSRLRVYGR
jgi:allantoicase